MRHLRFAALAGLLAGVPLHAQYVGLAPPVGVRVDSVVPGAPELAAASTVSDLLQGKVAGLNVAASSGTLGAAPRLWIRGASSLIMPLDPLVVVDGVRIASEGGVVFGSLAVPGGSRLEDLAPSDIVSVRVLRGPAATAGYGPDGVNGVLEIRTRSARAAAEGGPARVHGWSALSLRSETAEYPDVYLRPGSGRGGAGRVATCSIRAEAAGACIPDRAEPTISNPVAESDPYRAGMGFAAGASVGGEDLDGRLGYGLDAGFEDASGMHERNGRRHVRVGGSLRGSLPGGGFVHATAAHSRRDLDLPFEGNIIYGRTYAELFRAFRADLPADDDFYRNREESDRTRLGGSVEVPVLPWLALSGRAGSDEADVAGTVETGIDGATPAARTDVELTRRRTEWEARATVHGPFGDGLSGSLSAGLGSTGDRSYREARSAGSSDIHGWRVDARNAFVLGHVLLGDVALGGSVRRDRIGTLSGEPDRDSYSVGAEWSPRVPWRGSDAVRLRAAHGRTERGIERVNYIPVLSQPCSLDGCPVVELPVERTEETEAGFDAALLKTFEVGATAYRRNTRSVAVAPANRVTEAGSLLNHGIELTAGAHGSARGAAWRVELRGAWNRNRFDDVEEGSYFADGVTHRDGYPASSLFARPVTWDDRNGNGVLECSSASCEVQVGADPEYLGTTVPERVGSAAASLRFRGLRLHALADWQGGVHRYDAGRRLLCVVAEQCAASYLPGANLKAQAEILAGAGESYVGFVRDASFLRLREVAATFPVPVPGRGGSALELTVAARNLAVRTSYPGLDPETGSSGASPFVGWDYFAQPLPRTVTMRLDVRF